MAGIGSVWALLWSRGAEGRGLADGRLGGGWRVVARIAIGPARANGQDLGQTADQGIHQAGVKVVSPLGLDVVHGSGQGPGGLVGPNTGQGIEDIDQADNACFQREDRKSTRLNSSHVAISYAVFCLKK